VIRHNNRIPPYPETQTYVKRVLNYFDGYSKGNGTP
jgi:soluble lytic murein transglycosylase-like protein